MDLEIQQEDDGIQTKTFFKPDRNSYIPVDSCHYDPWFINVPKGQLIRLRRNCTIQSVFMDQATLIGDTFISKGYNEHFIHEKIKEVYETPRDKLIQDKEKEPTRYQELPIIMKYHIQHRQVEWYWSLLKADRQLSTILPDKPRFIYRRAPTLREWVVKNVSDPPKD